MTTLKEHSLNLQEQAYHDYPAWSYSKIAKYAKEGFSAVDAILNGKHDEPTASMEFGSLFDSMITKGKKTLDDYIVYDGSVPPSEKRVLDCLAQRTEASSLMSIPLNIIQQAMDDCQYYTNWKCDTRFKRLCEYQQYFEAASSGKKIVSRADWDDAVEMYKVFRSDSFLKELFGTKSTDEVEYLYQMQFLVDWELSEWHTVKLKIMPDLLKIDHVNKTVQPVDLKTSSIPAWNFKENFIKYRYDIQAKLYSDVLRVVLDDADMKMYTILPYLFTDISRSDKIPVTYVYDQTSPEQQESFSFTSKGKSYTYKGWQTLLNEILDYQDTNAKVPSNIELGKPNDILEIINDDN